MKREPDFVRTTRRAAARTRAARPSSPARLGGEAVEPGTKADVHHVTIRSDPLAIEQVRSQIVSLLNERGYDAEAVFAITVATNEALLNAHIHGNRRDASKHITVRYSVMSDRTEIEIADEGNGFDPGSVADPRDPERLSSSSGRGLLLMRSLLDEVVFSANGACVRLVMRRRGSGLNNSDVQDEAQGSAP